MGEAFVFGEDGEAVFLEDAEGGGIVFGGAGEDGAGAVGVGEEFGEGAGGDALAPVWAA